MTIKIVSLVLMTVLTLLETGVAEICEKDPYDCENEINHYGSGFSTTWSPPCSNEAVMTACPNYCKCITGNILTDCAADYLEKLYLCRNDNLLKYYLNIPQAMNWFKEILDGSWLSPSPSGRCTIEHQSRPDDEGDSRCVDSEHSHCAFLSLSECDTGGFEECYKECNAKRGVPCEPFIDNFVPPIGKAPQCFINWLNGASTTWYLLNLPRPVTLFVSELKADQASMTT